VLRHLSTAVGDNRFETSRSGDKRERKCDAQVLGRPGISPWWDLEINTTDLPKNWRSHPPPERLADLGTEWLRSGRPPVLLVPSAVVPQERNYLLNPAHRDFRAVRVGAPEPFSFDPRMWKG